MCMLDGAHSVEESVNCTPRYECEQASSCYLFFSGVPAILMPGIDTSPQEVPQNTNLRRHCHCSLGFVPPKTNMTSFKKRQQIQP